jgi:hypothetical protein
MSSLNLDPQLSKTHSLRGDSITDGWLKLDFATEILVRPMSTAAPESGVAIASLVYTMSLVQTTQ